MGSCVPPNRCGGDVPKYVGALSSPIVNNAVTASAAIAPAWIGRVNPPAPNLPNPLFADFDALASAFWTPPVPAVPWGTSAEEDTRILMLERLLAQQLSVVGNPSSNALEVKWQGTTFHSEPIPNASLRSRSLRPLLSPYDSEATEQVDGFALYLYRTVEAELGTNPTRLQSIISLVNTCIDGVSNVVYVGKALTSFPRPPLPHSLPTPLISTWPGGHAYFSGVIATLLYVVLTKNIMDAASLVTRQDIAARLNTMAQRIAENRERAALHFVEDSEVGLRWGFKVVEKILTEARAQADAETTALAATPGMRIVPGTLSDLYRLILKVA